MRETIGGLLIQGRKILLVRNPRTWILPGGQMEPGETHISCLLREFREEPNVIGVNAGDYYGSFRGLTPNSKNDLRLHAYFVKVIDEPTPWGEIEEVKWIDNISEINVSDTTAQAFESLRRDGYL